MKTAENNKLIAEFMGWTEDFDLITHTNDKWWSKPKTHKYHTSWDWLIPVVNKCYQEHMSEHIAEAVMTCDINEAYQAVVQFIKWYNEENKVDKTHQQLREILIKYNSPEYGDCIVDEICNLFDFPMTNEE